MLTDDELRAIDDVLSGGLDGIGALLAEVKRLRRDRAELRWLWDAARGCADEQFNFRPESGDILRALRAIREHNESATPECYGIRG